jgi:hypothetical protein
MLKTVNSFDIFDTLIGRICGEPESIFDKVAHITKYPNFKYIRKLSESKSNGSWENIWEEFKKLSQLSEPEINAIKNIEWDLEQQNSFPIKVNTCFLNSQDILISDMYLSTDMIKELLDKNNINDYEKIYVTPKGKRSGKIWKIIENDGYKISLHTGDNLECDLLSPKKHGIKASFFDKDYSDKEKFFHNKNLKDISNLLRISRLSNSYSATDSNLSIQWNILSNIYPIYIIIFTSINKQYYIDKLPEHYDCYINNFDSYINDIILLKSLYETTDTYISKLSIDVDVVSANKETILQYIQHNCSIQPKDNII